MSSVTKLVLMLLTVVACQGRNFVYRVAESDNAEQAAIADFLNAEEKRDHLASHSLDQPSPTEQHLPQFSSKSYNEWLDSVLDSFATSLRIRNFEGLSVYKLVADSVLSQLRNNSVNAQLFNSLRKQCGTQHTDTPDLEFRTTLQEKDRCLADRAQEVQQLKKLLTQDITVRDQVTSQLVCSLLPDALSCHEAALTRIVGCTGNRRAVPDVITSIRNLLNGYCSNGAQTITDRLEATPTNCLAEGVSYFLKYTGPAFLRAQEAVSNDQYPCLYAKYIGSVSKVILGSYCRASDLVTNIEDFVKDFSVTAGCDAITKIQG